MGLYGGDGELARIIGRCVVKNDGK